jgi:hypothetical protein
LRDIISAIAYSMILWSMADRRWFFFAIFTFSSREKGREPPKIRYNITNGWDRICRPVRAVTTGPFFCAGRAACSYNVKFLTAKAWMYMNGGKGGGERAEMHKVRNRISRSNVFWWSFRCYLSFDFWQGSGCVFIVLLYWDKGMWHSGTWDRRFIFNL